METLRQVTGQIYGVSRVEWGAEAATELSLNDTCDPRDTRAMVLASCEHSNVYVGQLEHRERLTRGRHARMLHLGPTLTYG